MMGEIKVVKIGRGVKGFFRVDRGTPLGNQTRVDEFTSREEAIKAYRVWLWANIKDRSLDNKVFRRFKFLVDEFLSAGSLVLGCHCAPLPCHAEVIKSAIEWYVGAHAVRIFSEYGVE